MDRAMVEAHLAQAERHVVEGNRHVVEQRGRVVAMDRSGLDTAEALRLLGQFESLQALHITDRDRLRQELAGLGTR